jgi:hypothetical protein
VTDLAAFIQLQHRVTSFLAEQTVDRLRALIDGHLTLALVSSTAPEPIPAPEVMQPEVVKSSPRKKTARTTAPRNGKPVKAEAEAIATRLRGCESMDEAAELLRDLGLTAEDQKDVVRALGLTPKGRKAEVTDQIIRQAVGARIKFAALRQG